MKKVEVCRIAPKPDLAENQTLALTFFDIYWLRFQPVERLVFYQTSSTDTLLIPKLKTSLSFALHHFSPLAGSLTWPHHSHKPLLSYVQGDTVSLTVAESDADFDHLVNSVFLALGDTNPLVPELDIADDVAAAMALQITVFPNRGFCIGITTHHAILDGKTAISFLKAWAHICRQHDRDHVGVALPALPSTLTPLYDRSVVNDAANLGELYSEQHQIHDGRTDNRSLNIASFRAAPKHTDDSIRGTFEFTRAMIQKLRENVVTTTTDDKGSPSSLHLSTFSLVCAYTWVCMVKAEEIKDGKTALIFTVDARSRMDPPIPDTYFGNCVMGRFAVAETKELLGEQDGLVAAVGAISEPIRNLEEKGVLAGAENAVTNFIDASLYQRIYAIAGSPRFGVYDTDFGWGRAKRVEITSIDKTGAISLAESKNGGGGVEVGLVMKKHSMQVFDALVGSLVNYSWFYHQSFGFRSVASLFIKPL